MQACAGAAIAAAKSHNIALVLDADGLWYLNNNTEVLNGYTNAIITPNVMEMKRLCEKLVSKLLFIIMVSLKYSRTSIKAKSNQSKLLPRYRKNWVE